MVRMIILKRRMHHGIAVDAAVDDLPRHMKSPPPPPQLITTLPSVDTRVGTPRRRWEKGSTPIKTHPPSPCTTRRSKRRRTRAPKTPPPVIHYRHHTRSSIQWLYLCHRFVQAYLHQRHLPDTHTETQPAHQFLVESIEHLVGKISTVLDNALLDFSTATMCFDDSIHTIENALSADDSYYNLPFHTSVDSIEHLIGSMSSILDEEILDFSANLQRLDNKIHAIESAFEDYGHPDHPTIQSITSNQHEIPARNLGPIAQHILQQSNRDN